MSRELNRAARRSQARKGKNRKSGMVALSLMATTSLMSSYVSLLRTEPSFAVADTSACTSGIDALTLDVSGTRTEDVERIDALQTQLDSAIISGSPEDCVTVTFFASGADKVLNFTAVNDSTAEHVVEYLEVYGLAPYTPRVFFSGSGEGITFDFSFDQVSYVYTSRDSFDYSPIEANLPLEIHDITFQNSVVDNTQNPFNAGGVIRAGDNLSIFGSQFISNTVIRGDAGAVFAVDDAIISDTVFRNNTAEGQAGALRVYTGATITSSTFENNSASGYSYQGFYGSGDGGAVWAYTDLFISSSTFNENYSSDDGGAVYLVYASYSAEGGSGISDSTFVNNQSGDDGGAVYVDQDSNFTPNPWNRLFSVDDSTFEDNQALGGKGGAMEVDSYTYVTRSTFTSNTSSNDGGAIYADSQFVVVIDSTFVDNDSGDSGGAIYFDADNAYVYSSTFEGNSASVEGGAIYADENDIFIGASTFVDNYASDYGGAIFFENSNNTITMSTFETNSAGQDGGAIYLTGVGDVEVSNSTFVSNSARDEGGAIYAANNNDILFNTFLNNLSDTDATPGSKENLGESLAIGEGNVVGNIFAGDPQYPQVEFWSGWYQLEYNLSTGNDFDGVATNRGNVSAGELDLDSELRDNETQLGVQTLSIGSGSAAYGFVPFDTAEGSLGDTPRDQRGVIRSAAFVNAGAFEGFVPRSTPSVLSPATFFVTEVIAATPKAGTVVKVAGLQLMRVSEVYVGGVKVKLTKASDGELSFKLPKSVTGPVQIRFVGAGHEHIHVMNVDGSIRNEAVVPGFGSNSTKLTKAMKNEIKAFVEANAGLTQVTCKGYTSAPATAQDLRLARERGQATCDYITKLNPALDVKVLAGAHTNTPGQKVRRVRIEMN